MSSIKAIRIDYILKVKEHVLKAIVEHLENARKITFYFDEKTISEKLIPLGDFFTDDECISDLVRKYCENQNDMYADLFNNHSDNVRLVAKNLDFLIDNYGIKMYAHVHVENEKYHIEVKGGNEVDSFAGTFKADNFSEVLEKVRIFTSTLVGISDSFSAHINEFSDDKVANWIKWDGMA